MTGRGLPVGMRITRAGFPLHRIAQVGTEHDTNGLAAGLIGMPNRCEERQLDSGGDDAYRQ
jgi:hypothetical protein